MKMLSLYLTALALQFLVLALCTAQYTPPSPQILPLYPRGVHFSIPDEEGITLVAYHANINEEFYSLEAGTIAVDIIKTRNNRWTYQDRTTRLKIGDIIYLWIHVVYEGLGYNLLDQMHHVTAFYNADGSPHTSMNETSVTFYNDKEYSNRQLLFEDHFDQLQSNKWRVVKQFSGPPDEEFVVYRDNESNVFVRNGKLHMKPTLLTGESNAQFIKRGHLKIPNCTGRNGTNECERTGQSYLYLPPVASGRMDTKHSFNFRYGRVEIRCKLPRGDWIYPVIMLKPVDAAYGVGYSSGELRIASVAGNRELRSSTGLNLDGHVLRAGAVVSPENSVRQNTMSKKISANYWSDDYHTFELQWTETTITVKVDGEQFGEKKNPASAHIQEIFKDPINHQRGQNAPFDKPFYLSIGVAVGGSGEFPDDSISGTHTKPWRNVEAKAISNFFNAQNTWATTWTDEESTLQVDYVKIWSL